MSPRIEPCRVVPRDASTSFVFDSAAAHRDLGVDGPASRWSMNVTLDRALLRLVIFGQPPGAGAQR
jgi:hypothetical protein